MAIQLGKRLMCSAGILALLCTAGSADTPSYRMTTNIPPEITTPDSVDTSIGRYARKLVTRDQAAV
jgi:hypothetical protein